MCKKCTAEKETGVTMQSHDLDCPLQMDSSKMKLIKGVSDDDGGGGDMIDHPKLNQQTTIAAKAGGAYEKQRKQLAHPCAESEIQKDPLILQTTQLLPRLQGTSNKLLEWNEITESSITCVTSSILKGERERNWLLSLLGS